MKTHTKIFALFFIFFYPFLLLANTKPNIIVIYVDDLDCDELGVLGNKELLTPNIDLLAKEGLIFNQAFVTSSICTPSRYGVLTGRYASRSQPLQNIPSSSWRNRNYPAGGEANVHFNAILGPGEKTIANHLQAAGYKTGIVGKWHLGRGPRGYKEEKLWFPKGVRPESQEGQRRIGDFYQNCVQYVKKNYGFDFVDGFYSNNARALGSTGYPSEYAHHNPEWMTARGIDFIEHNKEEPFFLYYALTLPHGEGMQIVETLVDADPLLTPGGKLDALPESGMPSRKSVLERIKKAGLPEVSAGMLWVDDAVGSLLNKVEECGLTENTAVFFISDHGNYAKEALYDGGAQVPYFVKWPKVIAKDQVCSEYVANIDVAPTLLEMARFSVEDPFDGVSIYSLLKGNKEPVRQHLMLEVGYGRAIMTKDWKYIALRFPDFELPEIEKQGGLTNVNYNASSASKNFRKNGVRYYPQHYYDFDQLYDRKQDAREQNNLFKNPEYAPQLKKMKTLLAQSLERMPHTFAEIKPKK